MNNPAKDCIVMDLTPEEYMAWKLVQLNSSGDRFFAEDYVEKFGIPNSDVITKLVTKDLVYAPFEKSGPYAYNQVIAKKKDRSVLLELAEELWHSYPATFPLSNGGMFVARTGDKQGTLINYMNLIGWSEERHQEVMIQLGRYIKAVGKGKINGCKLPDWIDAHMWDTMKDIPDQDIEISVFKVDI